MSTGILAPSDKATAAAGLKKPSPGSQEATDAPPPTPRERMDRRLFHAAWRTIAPAVLIAAEYAVKGMELADRPVAWVGGGPRRILGWAAIATFGVSLMLLIYTCFD
jgi:hypothetical protein